jgi:shikimate dehydrogenase
MIKLGLTGYPVGHSLSPKIQNAALNACGLEGGYSLFPILPDDMQALKTLLERVRSGEMTGLNVTIPHKQNVIPFLDELTPAAKSIGAVNIIYRRGARLIGDNTDAPGFLLDLKKFLTTVPHGDDMTQSHGDKNALVLGAGGSARSVVYALCNDGWRVGIAARRSEQAQQLADSLTNDPSPITIFEFSSLGASRHFPISKIFLIVNTTPLGMTPNVDQSPLPENTVLPEQTKIYDLIYNPRETKLVRDARVKRLHATTGLGMLIEQAALGFELWTGIKLSSDVFRNAAE